MFGGCVAVAEPPSPAWTAWKNSRARMSNCACSCSSRCLRNSCCCRTSTRRLWRGSLPPSRRVCATATSARAACASPTSLSVSSQPTSLLFADYLYPSATSKTLLPTGRIVASLEEGKALQRILSQLSKPMFRNTKKISALSSIARLVLWSLVKIIP